MQDQPRKLPVRPPLCPDCLTVMRYAASETDKTDSRMRFVMFVCDCGSTSEHVVADL
jgi:hypothetical protein